MKTLLRKTAIVTALICATALSAFRATAQDERLIYSKGRHTAIGITVDNATGAEYTIRDKNGNVVLQGRIKSNKTFFIPTTKLGKGSYRFVIGSLVLQEFEIR
ncbi:hypothetical protein [Taibaiella koreensis]|uniref:hypothetical protein n=1 Tax=Taibaiella koreensis TaxID=1268548 RepID=UPI000E59E760|nr:hypothetical protein [Taibaiella koreensis]